MSLLMLSGYKQIKCNFLRIKPLQKPCTIKTCSTLESGVDPGNEVVFARIPVRMIYLVIVFCSDLLVKRYEGDCA